MINDSTPKKAKENTVKGMPNKISTFISFYHEFLKYLEKETINASKKINETTGEELIKANVNLNNLNISSENCQKTINFLETLQKYFPLPVEKEITEVEKINKICQLTKQYHNETLRIDEKITQKLCKIVYGKQDFIQLAKSIGIEHFDSKVQNILTCIDTIINTEMPENSAIEEKDKIIKSNETSIKKLKKLIGLAINNINDSKKALGENGEKILEKLIFLNKLVVNAPDLY